MKLSVRPNYFNASFVEYDGSGLAPPLLVSYLKSLFLLTDFWFFFMCLDLTHNIIFVTFGSCKIVLRYQTMPSLIYHSVVPWAIKYPIRKVILKIKI